MNKINADSISGIFEMIDEFYRQQMEYQEKALAEIIQNFDFAVGSIECKARLMEILPEGANIICSPYIEDPTRSLTSRTTSTKTSASEKRKVRSNETCRAYEIYRKECPYTLF